MKTYQVVTLDNQVISFTTEDPRSRFPSFFAFGITKGGSTLLNNVLIAICQQYHKIPHVSLPDILFAEGIKRENIQPESVKNLYSQSGYCFGGFRECHSYLLPFLPGRKKILLVRDPRDILVSLYFSEKYSHIIPQKETEEVKELLNLRNSLQNGIDLNQFIEQKKALVKQRLESYHNSDQWDNCKLFRYEDIVLQKRQWIEEICKFIGLKLTQDQIQEILDRYDIIPLKEEQASHIRKVIPGDYKEKLEPETIASLNDYFHDILIKYNYQFNP